jgi:hypothetical protein
MKKSKVDDFTAVRTFNEGKFSAMRKSKVINGCVMCTLHEVH